MSLLWVESATNEIEALIIITIMCSMMRIAAMSIYVHIIPLKIPKCTNFSPVVVAEKHSNCFTTQKKQFKSVHAIAYSCEILVNLRLLERRKLQLRDYN